jgi:hypothetical protein
MAALLTADRVAEIVTLLQDLNDAVQGDVQIVESFEFDVTYQGAELRVAYDVREGFHLPTVDA